jgi:hypothetical protein
MDYDLLLILGLVMLAVSIPSLLSALIDDRPPLVAGFGLLLGIGMAAWGMISGNHGLNPAALTQLFFEVLGRYLP